MKFITKFGHIKHGLHGLRAVWLEEWHFKYQILVAVGAHIVAYVIGASPTELLVLFCAFSLAVAGEVLNTAIEDLGDRITLEHDEGIGAVKDMSQAFVILSSLPALAAFLWIVTAHSFSF